MKKPWLPVLLLLAAAGAAMGVPVEIQSFAAFPGTPPDFFLPSGVTGLGAPGTGWQPSPDRHGADHFLILRPERPVSARQLLAELVFPGPDPDHYFGKFGIDVTTDPEPAMEGRWMPLILEASGPEFGNRPLPAAPVLVLGPHQAPFSLTLRARAPFDSITGFRLRVFPESTAGRPPAVGRAAGGGFLLGSIKVEAELPRSTNLALGRQVYCSRQVEEGMPSRNLTDGFHATWSQPQRNPADPDAFFQLDLGQTTTLDHVTVRWHPGAGAPAAPPARLQVELLTESGGFQGSTVWRARPETSQGPGTAASVLQAGDGEGEFAGRRLLIQARGGPGDQPRISEIEVYPALRPEAAHWLADGKALRPGGMLEIPPRTRELSFTPVCPAAPEGVTLCRWRLEGWSHAWTTAIPGLPVRLIPSPPPGKYELVLQALHSDGHWDTSGSPLPVLAAASWWEHFPSAVAAASGAVLAAGAFGWWWFARRMRRRLLRTQQHLELNRDRLRISRDMHDEIGARLTSIALLAERTRRQPESTPRLLDDLACQARSTVEALDTIVWAVNPRHDTLGGLADYLSDYAPSYLESAGIECDLELCTAYPSRPLPLSVRHNLLMAAKEALQNTVKHSGARRCRVTLTDEGNILCLTISDDGRGVAAGMATGISHTGLESMHQRMAEAGGTCVLRPAGQEPDHGTRVTLTVPVPAEAALPFSP